MMMSQVVLPEQSLARLYPLFITNRKEDLKKVRIALSKSDYTGIGSIAHRIKGASGFFGHDELGLLATLLEECARERSFLRCQMLFHRLEAYLKNNLANKSH